MFTCLWQLWDWLDPPILTSAATMESKKLQQLQQANSHLAPKPMPPPKGFGGNEYNPRSPLFPPVPVHNQYQNLASNFSQINSNQNIYDSRGLNENHSHVDHQIYQNQRLYHHPRSHMHPTYSQHQHQNVNQNVHQMHQHPRQLQEQYRQIQQAKLQQQMQYQNQAMLNQQQTFASRQAQHFHQHHKFDETGTPVTPMRQNIPNNTVQDHRNVPTSLNLNPQVDYYCDYNRPDMVNRPLLNQSQIDQVTNQFAQQSFPKTNAAHQTPIKMMQNQVHTSQVAQNDYQNKAVSYTKHPPQNLPYQQEQDSSNRNVQTPPPTAAKPVQYVALNQGQQKLQSPTGSHLEKRRASGGNQALRAPVARRPVSAPIAMSGWLHKQGSDGLKVWRKRWFVLTEYCLFYYKGPEEEKLLGSVLLPSYTISVCSPDERNYRRYSFKCEHANMRTYLLAAESQQIMITWVKALKMASMMQCSSESDQASQSQSQPSLSSLNQSGDNSDSGIHTLPSQGKIAGTQTSPTSPQNNGPEGVSVNEPPLYANAPPKPRRTNDGGYSSPSPECSVERYEDPNYDIRRDPNRINLLRMNAKSPIPSDAIYESQGSYRQSQPSRMSTKSPEPMYNAQNLSLPLQNTSQMRLEHNKSPAMRIIQNKSPFYPDNQYPTRSEPTPPSRGGQKLDSNDNSENIIRAPRRFLGKNDEYDIYGENFNPQVTELRNQEIYVQNKNHGKYQHMIPSERRTPDTYGWSRMNHQERHSAPNVPNRNISDYEDIYNSSNAELVGYRRPMSPVGYSGHDKRGGIHPQRYTPTQLDLTQTPVSVQMRMKHSIQPKVSRPHSADFLEYEAKQNSGHRHHTQDHQTPRPKSSLDINRSPLEAANDNLYYSEAGYAEKMRQSALYVQKTPKSVPPQNSRQTYENRYSAESKRVNKEGDVIYSESSSTLPSNISSSKAQESEIQPYSGDSVISEGSLNQTRDSEEFVRTPDYHRQGASSSVPRSYKEQDPGLQFMRSASARLARGRDSDDLENGQNGARKVQQREESMKRLLEWKQRMLQSPLTRKGHNHSHSPLTVSRNPIMGQQSTPISSVGAHIRKPLPNHYNSYSSDDEDGRTSQSQMTTQQAGKASSTSSTTTTPSHSYTPTINITQRGQFRHEHNAPSPSFQRPKTPTFQKVHSQNISTAELSTESNIVRSNSNKSLVSEKFTPQKSPETQKINVNYVPVYAQHKHLKTAFQNTEFEMKKPLKLTEQKQSVTAQISSLKPAEISKEIQQPVINKGEKENEIKGILKPLKEPLIKSNSSEDEMEYTDNDLDEILDETKSSESTLEKSASQPEDTSLTHPDCLTPTNQSVEEHYMPMTPKKAILSPDHPIPDTMSIFRSNEIDESPYVEMTQGLNSNLLSSGFNEEKSSDVQPYELICMNEGKVEPLYMELSQFKSSFEEVEPTINVESKPKGALKKSGIKKYHDIKTIKKHNNEFFKNRSDLPDILKASHGNSIRSDSSDADDEASRDLDSLDTPCHPRFSLSDTFRPASYYLGVTGPPQEFPDSSDSEIVSPPPIPKSPPPIDDLDNSLSHNEYSLTEDFIIRDLKTSNSTSSTPTFIGTFNKSGDHKASRNSLPEKDGRDTKQFDTLKKRSSVDNAYTSLFKYNLDNKIYIESNRFKSSPDYAKYSRNKHSTAGSDDYGSIYEEDIKNKSDSNNDSDSVELRHSISSNDTDLERRLKRRPLSEESMSEINSIGSNFDETIESVDLDHYLKDLQGSDVYLYTKEMYPAPVGWRDDNPPKVEITDADENYPSDKFYENIVIKNQTRNSNPELTSSSNLRPPSRMSNLSNNERNNYAFDQDYAGNISKNSYQNHPLYYDSLDEKEETAENTKIVQLRQKNLSLHDAHCEIEDRYLSASNPNLLITDTSSNSNDVETVSLNIERSSISNFEGNNLTPLHSRDNSNLSEQSAPYYYSDLASRQSSNQDIASSCSQMAADGRNNRLNNTRFENSNKKSINQIQNPIKGRRSDQLRSSRDSMDTYKLAAEARSVSVEFLNSADKPDCIDKRNIYESDTLKRQKAMDSLTSLQSNPEAKNLYPSVSHDKKSFTENESKSELDCRSNSLEGLLENVLTSRELPQSSGFHLHPETFQTSSSIVDMLLQSAGQSGSDVFKSPVVEPTIQQHMQSCSADACEGDMLWEEDTLWRESLRRVSHRHARSLDDLDSINVERNVPTADVQWGIKDKKQPLTVKPRISRLTRGATYVNDNIVTPSRTLKKQRKRTVTVQEAPQIDDEYVQLAFQTQDDGVYETLTQNVQQKRDEQFSNQPMPMRTMFEIDREKLRQWDWMSSGLLKNENGCFGENGFQNGQNVVMGSQIGNEGDNINMTGGKMELRTPHKDASDGNLEASGSISVAGLTPHQPSQSQTLPSGGIPIRAVSPRVRLSQENLLLVSNPKLDSTIYQSRDRLTPTNKQEGLYDRNDHLKHKPVNADHRDDLKERYDRLNLNNQEVLGSRNDKYNNDQHSLNNIPINDNYNRNYNLSNNDNIFERYQQHHNNLDNERIYGVTADLGKMKSDKNYHELHSQHDRTPSTVRNNLASEGSGESEGSSRRRGERPVRRTNSQLDELHLLERDTPGGLRNLDMSAGDLLGRTHEELVLLLIQLRRQNTATARAIEQCCSKIHHCQSRLSTADAAQRLENFQRLDQLKQHLLDLEKQYEKSKPLVNLVDNMVKLGALYRGSPNTQVPPIPTETATLDRLEFNQRIQERRLLQEERKHWDRLSPNQMQLQSKVKQLYQLDQLLQEESGTLQGLQRDKEALERALGNLRSRLQAPPRDPAVLEQARRQQQALENELSRVHLLLAHNSKKLEQTVAGNARLEQELLVLRQKLQESRRTRGSQQISNSGAPDSVPYAGGATALLESELRRVQQVVGDLQRQRQELSLAVRQLTDKSQCLVQQITPRSSSSSSSVSSNMKKRPQSSWFETDLDSLETCDHGANWEPASNNSSTTTPLYIDTSTPDHQHQMTNLDDGDTNTTLDASESDVEQSEMSGLNSGHEKQEIKTVRIVKRESERRQRDRERSVGPNWGQSAQNLDNVTEEDTRSQTDDSQFQRSMSLPRSFHHNPLSQSSPILSPQESRSQYLSSMRFNSDNYKPSQLYGNENDLLRTNSSLAYDSRNLHLSPLAVNYLHNVDNNEQSSYSYNSKENINAPLKQTQKSESIVSLNRSIELSPVFQSEAAKEIINEISVTTDLPGPSGVNKNQAGITNVNKQRRPVPKEKRRHYTAPHHLSSKSLQTIQAENDLNRNSNWRARDDLDMERALRPRSNAPDVVRSTMEVSPDMSEDLASMSVLRDARSTVYRDTRYTENTIDKLLAAPSKIVIPERYIPEQTPELTPEEIQRRQQKAESIRKMLSTAPMGPTNKSSPEGPVNEDKRQREHLLQLNQILAKQVMEMSKIVAGSNNPTAQQ